MGRKSRSKGARGELEVVDLLRAVFPNAERSYHQARDGSDAPDVMGTPYWIEAEMSQKPSPHAKMRQAEEASEKERARRIPRPLLSPENAAMALDSLGGIHTPASRLAAIRAASECPEALTPVVFTRQCSRSRSGEWLVTMRARDWIAIMAKISGA